jgi:hypothetical protein
MESICINSVFMDGSREGNEGKGRNIIYSNIHLSLTCPHSHPRANPPTNFSPNSRSLFLLSSHHRDFIFFEGFPTQKYSDCQLCSRRIFFSFIFMHYGYCHERNVGDDGEIMSRGGRAGSG